MGLYWFALKGLVIRVLGLGDVGLLVRDMWFRDLRKVRSLRVLGFGLKGFKI